MNKIYSYTPEQQHLNIEVVRKGEIQNVQLTPILVEQTNNQGGRESKYAIGIYNHIIRNTEDYYNYTYFKSYFSVARWCDKGCFLDEINLSWVFKAFASSCITPVYWWTYYDWSSS